MTKKNKKIKMHVKKGDTIQIISGKHKGEIGEIIKILPTTSQVIIKNVNIKIKHVRPNQEEENGQIISLEGAIHSSKVMLYSTKYKIRSRHNKIFEDNQKRRLLKKTQEIVS